MLDFCFSIVVFSSVGRSVSQNYKFVSKLTRCVCPPSHTDKYINDKTNELLKEKIVPAKVAKRLNSKAFKIAELNIGSMVENIDEFRMYALDHQYDIICVNETW